MPATPMSNTFSPVRWLAGLPYLVCAAIAGACVLSADMVRAADEPVLTFDLPAAPASTALQRFSRFTGLQLIYASEAVRGVRLRALKGQFTVREALKRMLAETVLTGEEYGGAFAVRRLPRLPAPIVQDREPPDDAEIMNPFEVRVDLDRGYGALHSNALTAFDSDLLTLPASAEIFTRTFIDDVGAVSIEEMLVGYNGAAGFTGTAILVAPGDRDGIGGLSVRGMAAPSLMRDGFVGPRANQRTFSGSTDNFSTERVELLEGPQSLLYGGGGGGGIVNVVSKQAAFRRTRGELRHTFDSLGSQRVLLDYNAGGATFAARAVGTLRNTASGRERLRSRLQGFYGQLAWRPNPATTVRLWGEYTDSDVENAFAPDLSPFMTPDDPHRGLNARYLALTDQLGDLEVVAGGLDYGNVESLAGWWSGERIVNAFAGLTVETRVNRRLFARVAVLYGETDNARIRPGRLLVPAGYEGNPFEVTAMRVTPSDNQQPHRVKGIRATLLLEGGLFAGRAHSQTAFGAESLHFTDVDSVDYAYYLADEQGRAIVDPAQAAHYGRTPLGPLYYEVGYGAPRRPLFRPGTGRIVVDGRHYVRLPRVLTDPAQATPANPLGLVPNTPGIGNGFSGNYAHGTTRSRGVFVANLTEWHDGRFATLAGFRYNQTHTFNAGVTGISYRPPWDGTLSGNLGFAVRLRPDWYVYGSVSSSYASLQAQTRDLAGEQLRPVTAGSAAPELGLKFQSADGRFAAALAVHPVTVQRDEAALVDAAFLDAVNPDGLNGRAGTPDRWVNVDRRARGASLRITATPSPAWRLRLSLAWLDGETVDSVRFSQRYNDEFHADASGRVTYRDGTPVLVDPAGAGGPAQAVLTLAMLNDPAHPYFARPDADSGSITGTLARAALGRVDPVHGPVATGVTGLPLTRMQYAWDDPHRHEGAITVFHAGEKSTGFHEFTVNAQNHYTFERGPLRGLGLFVDVRTYFRNRGYHVRQPSSEGGLLAAGRRLHRLPNATAVGIGLNYRIAFAQRRAWTIQINVQNALDDRRVWIVPDPVDGSLTQARLSQPPRSFVVSNTIEF